MEKAPMPWLAERAARMSPRWSPWPIRLIVLAVLAVLAVAWAVPSSRDGGWLALFPVSILLGAWVLAEYSQRVRRQLRVGLLPSQTSEAIAVAGVAVLALSGAILSATMASDLWTRMQAGRSENTVPELVWAPVVGRPLEMRVVRSVLESEPGDGMQLRVDWQLRNTGDQGVVVNTEGLQVRQNHGLSRAPQDRATLTLPGHASSEVLRSTYALSSDTQADALYWGAFDHPDVYVVHLMPAFPAPARPANDSAAWDPEAARHEQAPKVFAQGPPQLSLLRQAGPNRCRWTLRRGGDERTLVEMGSPCGVVQVSPRPDWQEAIVSDPVQALRVRLHPLQIETLPNYPQAVQENASLARGVPVALFDPNGTVRVLGAPGRYEHDARRPVPSGATTTLTSYTLDGAAWRIDGMLTVPMRQCGRGWADHTAMASAFNGRLLHRVPPAMCSPITDGADELLTPLPQALSQNKTVAAAQALQPWRGPWVALANAAAAVQVVTGLGMAAHASQPPPFLGPVVRERDGRVAAVVPVTKRGGFNALRMRGPYLFVHHETPRAHEREHEVTLVDLRNDRTVDAVNGIDIGSAALW